MSNMYNYQYFHQFQDKTPITMDNNYSYVYSYVNTVESNQNDIMLGEVASLDNSAKTNNTEREFVAIESNADPIPLPKRRKLKNPVENVYIYNTKPGVRYLNAKKIALTRPKQKNKKPSLPKLTKIVHCHICSLSFTSENLLKRHQRTHEYEKPHKCDICPATFNVLENLTLHISIHKKKPFRCPQCGKIFNRLASLDGHIKSHFKSEYFLCNTCGDMFHFERKLKEHMETSHPHEKYKLQQEREAKARQRKLAKGKLFSCQFCGKSFTKNCLLMRHERIHKQERPFKCEMCDQAFIQKNSLVIHRLKHTGDRPHKCPKCPQGFSQKGNLQLHIYRCHTESADGEIPYPCTQCTCSFRKLGTLNAHISRYHHDVATNSSSNDIDCDVNNVMEQLAQLNQTAPPDVESELLAQQSDIPWSVPHLENVVPLQTDLLLLQKPEELSKNLQLPEESVPSENSLLKFAEQTPTGTLTHRTVTQTVRGKARLLICNYCPKQFRRPSDLLRHIRIHTKEKPYECQECKRKFAVKATLNVHMRIHDKNPQRYPCPICSKSFSIRHTLDIHCKMQHSETCMFTCLDCPEKFNTSNALRLHQKTHAPKPKDAINIGDKFQLHIQLDEPIDITADDTKSRDVKAPHNDVSRIFECTFCHKSFKRNGHLKQHIANHMGLRPYQCNECGKCFGKSSILNRHLLYHSKVKPFKCDQCWRRFQTADQLKRHGLAHTTDHNIMCPYCLKKFKSKSYCRVHMKIHKTTIIKQVKDNIKSGNLIIETNYIEEMPMAHNNSYVVDPVPAENDNNMVFENNSINPISEPNLEINPNMITISNDIGLNQANNVEYFLVFTKKEIEANANNIPSLRKIAPVEIPKTTISDITTDIPCKEASMEPVALLDTVNSWLNTKVDLDTEIPKETSQSKPTSNNLNNTDFINSYKSPKSNKNIRKHQCELCPKAFQKPVDLRRHIRTHTGERPFKCDICSKSFSLLCTLNSHFKTHSDVKPMFPCHICWNTFASTSSLSVHMRIHNGIRPYKCKFCSLTFRTSGHRMTHLQVHLREAQKKNGDPKMIKTKKEKGKLMALLEVVDAVNVSVANEKKCDDETRELVQDIEQALIDDVDNTSNELKCFICDKEYNDPSLLEAHVLQHEMPTCDYCKKPFKSQSLLGRHMVVHTKEKPFSCTMCNKSYTQRASLQTHMRIHFIQSPPKIASA